MRIYYSLLIAVSIIAGTGCSQAQNKMNKIDKTTVQELDLDKYLGKWYEIARYPHRFEKDLQGVTATYSMRPDGKIKVLNQGYQGSVDGPKSIAVGKAKRNKNGIPSQFRVSFFWIFYADYFVLELEPNYQWALVGSSSDDFLWILSRSSKMDESTYHHILQLARDRGYDLTNLQKVEHR